MNTAPNNSSDQGNSDSATDADKNEEKIINWQEEATAIINDVKTHVKEIEISKQLPCNESNIYLNISTIEDQRYCVHASSLGFRIVACGAYDTIDPDKAELKVAIDPEDEDSAVEVYETPYALLDKISPRYVESFGNQLCKQLLLLQQMRTQFNEEDEDELEEEDDDDDEHKRPEDGGAAHREASEEATVDT